MENLDPQVVMLAKAIKQKESGGNFSAPGKSGEYGGYQFTPDTWASSSRKYLGRDVPLQQATNAEQNEVAYKRIKEWKDKNYNVMQIASMWNAGEGKPNAYKENWKGVNNYGVAYDTPKYAEEVGKLYHSMKGSGANNTTSNGYVDPTAPQQSYPTGDGYVPESTYTPEPDTQGEQVNRYTGLLGTDPKAGIIEKLADNSITRNIPGHTLGKAVGNSISDLWSAATTGSMKPIYDRQNDPNAPTMPQVFGDAIGAATLPLWATGAGASIPGSMALGGVSGASSAMAEGETNPGVIAGKAKSGALTAGLFNVGGRVAGKLAQEALPLWTSKMMGTNYKTAAKAQKLGYGNVKDMLAKADAEIARMRAMPNATQNTTKYVQELAKTKDLRNALEGIIAEHGSKFKIGWKEILTLMSDLKGGGQYGLYGATSLASNPKLALPAIGKATKIIPGMAKGLLPALVKTREKTGFDYPANLISPPSSPTN